MTSAHYHVHVTLQPSSSHCRLQLLLRRVAHIAQAAYSHRSSSISARSVCLSVRVSVRPLVTTVNSTTAVDSIGLPFAVVGRMGARNHASMGVQIPHGKGQTLGQWGGNSVTHREHVAPATLRFLVYVSYCIIFLFRRHLVQTIQTHRDIQFGPTAISGY